MDYDVKSRIVILCCNIFKSTFDCYRYYIVIGFFYKCVYISFILNIFVDIPEIRNPNISTVSFPNNYRLYMYK